MCYEFEAIEYKCFANAIDNKKDIDITVEPNIPQVTQPLNETTHLTK